MPHASPKERACHGVRFYQSRDPEIRALKREHSPEGFGYRIWTSCWLLMEYLKDLRLPEGLRVMDVGCGWGLAGIYCAKALGARVTAVDADPEVFPFLRLHAELNDVGLTVVQRRLEDLTVADLAGIDLLIGADICFWDEMLAPLLGLIDRALQAGVGLILIADPGRGSFHALAQACAQRHDATTRSFYTLRPYPLQGRILRVINPAEPTAAPPRRA